MANQHITLQSVDATIRHIDTPMGLVIDEVRLGSGHTYIDTEPSIRVGMEKDAALEARISESSLAAYLNQQSPGGLRNFVVQLQDGKLVAEATARMLIEIRATAVCTLRIVDAKQIWVDLVDVQVLGGVSAKGLVEGQIAKINPVLDASDLPLEVRFTGIAIDSGFIIVYGEAKPPS